MIDLLPLSSPAPGMATAPVPTSGVAPTSLVSGDGAAGSATMPSFGATLGQLLEARDQATDRSVPPALSPTPPAPLPTLPPAGQEAAADGKKLPDPPGADQSGPDARPDIAPVWLSTAVVPLQVAAPSPPSPSVPAAQSADAVAETDTAGPGLAPEAAPDATPRTRTRKNGRFAAPAPAAPAAPGASAASRPADRRPTTKERDPAPVASSVALTAPVAAITVGEPAPTVRQPDPVAPRGPIRTPDAATPIASVTAQVATPSLAASPATTADAAPSVATIQALPIARAAQPAASPTGAAMPSIVPPAAMPSTPDVPIDRLAPAASESADPVTSGAAQPQPAITVSSTPQPASRVFAAAFATAAAWRERAGRAPARDLADTAMMVATGSLVSPERAVVSATGDAQGTPLDLTRDSGLHRMIDRIEALRDAAGDAANASDTRIRLIPDALGSVEIAVRQEGDRVHVRFTAEQEATRVLIADAQPRLTDLAAARGVRIGETSVGTGGGETGGNAATPPRPAPVLARAPRSAASDDASTTDQRLA